MRALLIVLSLATAILARPDIGLDLRQRPLATSYGVPSASITNLNAHSFLPPSPTFETPSISTIVPFYSGPIVSSTPAPIFESTISSTPAPFYAGPISTTAAPFYDTPLVSNNLIYNPGVFGGQSISSQFLAEPAQVQKHVYFYEAPQEQEDFIPQYKYPTSAKKNVKILFIKAPQYTAPVYPVAPIPPQNPEKTIVYVLVKKPDPQEQIVVPTLPPTAPPKPEVYFIKYKNQQEAEEKVSNTLNEHSNSGANIITSGIDTPQISGGGFIGNPILNGPIISTTESPFALGGGFIGTSTISPLVDTSFSSFAPNIGLAGNSDFISSTYPTIVSSTPTPYTFAPVHPHDTYGAPFAKKRRSN